MAFRYKCIFNLINMGIITGYLFITLLRNIVKPIWLTLYINEKKLYLSSAFYDTKIKSKKYIIEVYTLRGWNYQHRQSVNKQLLSDQRYLTCCQYQQSSCRGFIGMALYKKFSGNWDITLMHFRMNRIALFSFFQ